MALVLPINLFYDPDGDTREKRLAESKRTAKPKREKRLFCASCRHPVTSQNERIPVQGNHEHSCTNPHGLTYHIGCFRHAAGCEPYGRQTTEYSWFSGYTWQIALCSHCQVHLGWRFISSADDFHGLILGRLTSRAG
jgi:hypothetical protein